MSQSGSGDGRKGNRPPDKNKIRPGEVRNPNGRKGKAKAEQLSSIDEFILQEARRIVSRDAAGEVSAAKRLVQEEYLAALIEKDPKARARLLSKISQVETKADNGRGELIDWVLTCKAKYELLFRKAKERRSPAPDVCHSDHVNLVGDTIVISGPVDVESRKQWEQAKALIKIAAWMHERSRQCVKLDPTPENYAELKAMETHRRFLMRCVPKGWNWRENIYCRYSQTASVQKTISDLRSSS